MPSNEPFDQRDDAGREYLLPGGSPTGGAGRSRRRTGLVAGAVVAVLAVAGVAYGAYSFLSGGGEQPAAVMPAATIGYVSVDLDPSASQKIEAIRMIRKFPALKDEIGLDAADDLRRALFEQAQKDGTCPDVDYDTAVRPWLGDRLGVGVVRLGDGLAPVLALQISDQAKAVEGVKVLTACAANGDAPALQAAYLGDYVLFSDGQSHVDAVAAAAQKASLADDADFQRWTAEAGDPGVVNVYVSKEAPGTLTDLSGLISESPAGMTDRLGQMQQNLLDQYEGFEGAAGALRFHDGALEAEFAGAGLPQAFDGLGDGTQVAGLPPQTALAWGANFREGWLGEYLDSMASSLSQLLGEHKTAQDLYDEIEAQTGLRLPGDLETLVGHRTALAMDGGIDFEAISKAADVPDIPVGVVVAGDVAGVKRVLEKVNALLEPDASVTSMVAGERIAYGLDPAWEQTMLTSGGLADSEPYRRVIPHASTASAVFYVNFDAGQGWLTSFGSFMGGGARQFRENVEPLDAFGVSAWKDGDVQHALLKLTTD